MTADVVLHTDVVIEALRGRRAVLDRLSEVSPDDVAVASMTVAELLYGAAVSGYPDRNEGEIRRFLREIRVLPFGVRAAVQHSELRRALRAQPIGPNDLVIAATALSAGATLVTGNVREFGRVPGLRTESWTA